MLIIGWIRLCEALQLERRRSVEPVYRIIPIYTAHHHRMIDTATFTALREQISSFPLVIGRTSQRSGSRHRRTLKARSRHALSQCMCQNTRHGILTPMKVEVTPALWRRRFAHYIAPCYNPEVRLSIDAERILVYWCWTDDRFHCLLTAHMLDLRLTLRRWFSRFCRINWGPLMEMICSYLAMPRFYAWWCRLCADYQRYNVHNHITVTAINDALSEASHTSKW